MLGICLSVRGSKTLADDTFSHYYFTLVAFLECRIANVRISYCTYYIH